MGTSKPIALYGGSFDPPHYGHLFAVAYLLASGEFREVWMVPTYRHAFGKQSVAYEHRMEMCRKLVDGLDSRRVTVANADSIVAKKHGESRTIWLLEALRDAGWGDGYFRIAIGEDILPETKDWLRWDEVRRLAKPFVIPRGPHSVIPEVSSTEVRRLMRGRYYADAAARTPPSVFKYMVEHGLYVEGE